jgi:agmatine/peptidylarginine deiminase
LSIARIPLTLVLLAGFPAAASAQLIKDGRLVYPEGVPVSRALTPVERQWLLAHPLSAGAIDTVTPPPVGPVHCQAEYEPQEGIIISWQGNGGLTGVQADMAKRITVDAASKVYVVVANASGQSAAASTLSAAGCDMSKVTYLTRTLDSIWMCDYGPRFCFEGDCRITIDHKYNRPRPNDDVFPDFWAQTYRRQGFYQLGDSGHQLIHGGGNYHLDALGHGFATRLTVNENNPPATTYAYPEATIVQTWGLYQGLQHHFFDPYPTSVDSTQHLDMWMQMVDDHKVVISTWPLNVGSTQANICDDAAAYMTSQGYTVARVPAYLIGGVHYTFTNTVFCNNVLLVPSYTAAGGPATSSPTALATFQSMLPPGKTAIAVNCQSIIGLAGAIHCIVRIVPAPRGLPGSFGGLAPTAYLQTPNGGQAYTPGQQLMISWISDDDDAVTTCDLLLSTDGGATYPITIATGLAPVGSYPWTVPSLNTSTARVRVVAHDGPGNSGSDDSDANFTIGSPCYANCDASTTAPVLNVLDFSCFLNRFAAGESYANCDGSTAPPVLNVLDFACFLNAFAAGCS